MKELADLASIRVHYGDPSRLVLDKQLDHLDEHSQRFIALSPFVVASTSDRDGPLLAETGLVRLPGW